MNEIKANVSHSLFLNLFMLSGGNDDCMSDIINSALTFWLNSSIKPMFYSLKSEEKHSLIYQTTDSNGSTIKLKFKRCSKHGLKVFYFSIGCVWSEEPLSDYEGVIFERPLGTRPVDKAMNQFISRTVVKSIQK